MSISILNKYKYDSMFLEERLKLHFSMMVIDVFHEPLKSEFEKANKEDWYYPYKPENEAKIIKLEKECTALTKHGLKQLAKLTGIKRKRLKKLIWHCNGMPSVKEMIKIGIALNRHIKLNWENIDDSIRNDERIPEVG